jgi:hypothetical protein
MPVTAPSRAKKPRPYRRGFALRRSFRFGFEPRIGLAQAAQTTPPRYADFAPASVFAWGFPANLKIYSMNSVSYMWHAVARSLLL